MAIRRLLGVVLGFLALLLAAACTTAPATPRAAARTSLTEPHQARPFGRQDRAGPAAVSVTLAFAGDVKVKATIETLPLESINDVFSRLKKGQITGRVVLDIRKESFAKVATARLAS